MDPGWCSTPSVSGTNTWPCPPRGSKGFARGPTSAGDFVNDSREDSNDPWLQKFDGHRTGFKRTDKDCWGGGFSSNRKGPLVLSECRDLVVVPCGADWTIRELSEKHPQYCWKFAGTGSIAQYHFDLAAKQVSTKSNDSVPSKLSQPSLPVFYATLPHVFSPTEFSVQPKYLERVRTKMAFEMNEKYASSEDHQGFQLDHLVDGVACAVSAGSEWVRGRVRRMAGTIYVLVEFVDYGTTKIIEVEKLKWLHKRFGRLPPMALPCRMKDVYINDLDVAKVDRFQTIVDQCKRVVRVELCNAIEPYVVNLYHPTVEGNNLGVLFYRREDDKQREESKVRKWVGHVRRVNCDNDSDFEQEEGDSDDAEFDDEDDDESYQRVEYIRSMDRCAKAGRVGHSVLHLGHSENVRLVYLHDDWQLELRSRIEQSLKETFDTLPPFPLDWITISTACCIRDETGSVKRATIEKVDEHEIELILSDYGNWVNVAREEIYDKLRPLPVEFDAAPLLYLVSLTDSHDHFPHPTESEVLSEVLKELKTGTFIARRGQKRVPLRGQLVAADGRDIGLEVTSRLVDRRAQIDCWEVVLYDPRYSILSHRLRMDYKHRLHPPVSLLKGTLKTEYVY